VISSTTKAQLPGSDVIALCLRTQRDLSGSKRSVELRRRAARHGGDHVLGRGFDYVETVA
jgi:hypothetical protein